MGVQLKFSRAKKELFHTTVKETIQTELVLSSTYFPTPESALKTYLDDILYKYLKDLQGAALAYDDVSILSHTAPITVYSSYIRIVFKTTFIIFRPKPGDVLVGIVREYGTDFIRLLVLDLYTVFID